ncbi:putative L-type lectin-domain containing receptor kinase S.5 [Curcuma longa]|uniref:putative L-type lectin-domain containing receptor kinase S.5 n=1 Tax=Curcuma longa TaxID=136217 RepID=UPI003D9E3C7B
MNMNRHPLPPLLRLPAASFFLLFLLHSLSVQSQIVTGADGIYSAAFPYFDSDGDATDLRLFGDADINLRAIHLTPDSINDPQNFMINKSGRAFLNRPFTLWQLNSSSTSNATANATAIASFNTTFKIEVSHRNNTTPGEGLAFLLSSYLASAPPGSDGGFLGLTNDTLNGNLDNHFVAIEFDTVRQAYLGDPDDNHVGLDINGVNSTMTASLNFPIASTTDSNHTVWIDYDGAARYLRIYMVVGDDPKPASTVLETTLDLSVYLQQTFYFGFAASTGINYQRNSLLAWNLTVVIFPEDEKRMPAWKIGAIAGGVFVAVVVLGAGLWAWLQARRKMERDASANSSSALVLETLKILPGTPREFEFKDLYKATNSFDEKLKLGKGGFGEVYRGVLPGENKQVAVKRFSRGATSAPHDFLKELIIINRLRHKHLAPLVGWCHTDSVLLLVYEYMPNGSLDHHLFEGPGGKPTATLSWERRYNVITGVASALHYLHNEYDQTVVHRDLKASNIMLDANFNARLGDFGLARALETDKTSYADQEMAGVPGTMGYIAPECFHTGKATRESDVFGFGAVVLEVVCGRRPRSDIDGFHFLCDWVWKLYREGRILEAVDPRLEENDYDPEDARRLLLLALACSHPIPSERPKTELSVQIISRAMAPPVVPHFKPAFVWPAVRVVEDSSSRLTVVTSSCEASSME